MRAPPSGPNHLPKAPAPNAITLGLEFQHEFGGGGGVTDIQLVTGTFELMVSLLEST